MSLNFCKTCNLISDPKSTFQGNSYPSIASTVPYNKPKVPKKPTRCKKEAEASEQKNDDARRKIGEEHGEVGVEVVTE